MEQNGHWVLTIHGQQGFQEYYNPPGDGTCGDHVVAKILRDAQQRSGEHLYPQDVTENSSSPGCTSGLNQFNPLIDGARPSLRSASSSASSAQSSTIESKSAHASSASTAAERFKASAKRSVTSASRFQSELERMSFDLNQRAEKLIDELSKCSSEVQKDRWEKFDHIECPKFEQTVQAQASSSQNKLGYGHLFRREARLLPLLVLLKLALKFLKLIPPVLLDLVINSRKLFRLCEYKSIFYSVISYFFVFGIITKISDL